MYALYAIIAEEIIASQKIMLHIVLIATQFHIPSQVISETGLNIKFQACGPLRPIRLLRGNVRTICANTQA